MPGLTRFQTVSLLGSLALAVSAEDIPGFKHYRAADLTTRERALTPKVEGNKPAVDLLDGSPATRAALLHRAATGEAELHEEATDFMVIQSGTAILKVDGKLVEPRTVEPGEFAALKIAGGEVREVGPGDIILVPAKLPHQIIVNPGKPISYVVVKLKVQQ